MRFNQTIDIGGLRQYLRCIRFKPYSAVNLMTRAAQSESLEQRTQRILQSLFCQSKAYVLRFASSSAVESMFNRSAVSFICVLLIFLMPCVENFAAQSNWRGMGQNAARRRGGRPVDSLWLLLRI